jgi:hypothetical protein
VGGSGGDKRVRRRKKGILLILTFNRHFLQNFSFLIRYRRNSYNMTVDAAQQQAAGAVVAAAEKPGVVRNYIDGERHSAAETSRQS